MSEILNPDDRFRGDASMNPTRYLKIFIAAMDKYSGIQGYGGKELNNGETRDMIYDVCEEIRKHYGLSDGVHESYRRMVLIQVFGKNAGRK